MKCTSLAIIVVIAISGINKAHSQIESILDVTLPSGLYSSNDTLYIGTYNNLVYRNVLGSNSPLEPFFPSSVYRFARYDNELCYSNAGPNIYCYNLDDDSARIVFEFGRSVMGLAIWNDHLYFSEFSFGEIRKIDLVDAGFGSELVVSGLDTLLAIAEYEGHLYITENRTGSILKVNLDLGLPKVDTVFYNTLNSPNELYRIGDYMYISEFRGNKISRFNLKEASPQLEDVVINILTPAGLTSDEDYLYVSSFEFDEILRVPLSLFSSIENIPDGDFPIIYPNPTTGEFRLKNLNRQEDYFIYNLSGQLIQSGKVRNNQSISIENANNQNYLIKIGQSGPVQILMSTN